MCIKKHYINYIFWSHHKMNVYGKTVYEENHALGRTLYNDASRINVRESVDPLATTHHSELSGEVKLKFVDRFRLNTS